MKTDDLITLLATHAGPPLPSTARRLSIALGAGLLGAVLLMVVSIGLRSDLDEALLVPMFWVKLAFPVSLAVAALVISSRLARPGVAPGRAGIALIAPVAIMWLLAARELLGASDEERTALIFGDSWRDCIMYVSLLSLPVLAASMWALRGLAPTRPALAGAAAGMLAGAMGAAVYSWHCPEMHAPFLGIWYLLSMLIPAAAGALIGSRLLRW